MVVSDICYVIIELKLTITKLNNYKLLQLSSLDNLLTPQLSHPLTLELNPHDHVTSTPT